MQVTETLNDGLRREFRVVVPAADLGAKVEARLGELKDRVKINGFRPGKVPVDHLKRLYGRSVMAETIEAAMQEANSKIVSDNNYKLASQPKVTLPEAQAEVQNVVEGKADLSYSVAIEILPHIELADFKGIALQRFVAAADDSEIDEGVKRIADQSRPFAAKGEGAKVEAGDRVVVSFVGTIDGTPFDGGSADDITVEIGSKTFLPGFEEQLVGMTTGEPRVVNLDFPANYLNNDLAGKSAVFNVTAKSIEAPGTVTVDDEFAKSLGMDSLSKLKDAVKDRIQREHAGVSRRRLKRALLDEMDKRHQFELPPSMVDEEFQSIWGQVQNDLKEQKRSFEDEGTTEDAAKADYRKIAERRVRLGLVLAEIGERNNIKVTEDELNRAVSERLRQFPGQERQVWDYYQKNPDAVASLRAPIFEEKVVDFIVELAKVDEKTVSREELYKEDEEAPAA